MTDYANHTVFQGALSSVMAWAERHGVPAYVSPQVHDLVVVYPHQSWDAPVYDPAVYGADLARSVGARVLTALVEDDAVLTLWLHGAHGLVFYAMVGHAGVDDPDVTASVVDALGADDDAARVRSALSITAHAAAERHLELMDALDLPPLMVDMGFAYLDEGETPHSLQSHEDVTYVGPPLPDEPHDRDR